MIRRLIIILALTAGLGSISPAHAGEVTIPREMRFMTTPCPYEDAPNCFWDASRAGNGAGHSFYSIRIGRMDCIRYWDAAYNRRHGYCIDPS